jgi:hypothetical protein
MAENRSTAGAAEGDDRLVALLRLTELLASRAGDIPGSGDRFRGCARAHGAPTLRMARRGRGDMRAAWRQFADAERQVALLVRPAVHADA